MIHSTSNSDHTARTGAVPSQPPAPRSIAAGRDQFNTPQVQRLREALARQPEVRPEFVAMGQRLAADPAYPPDGVLRKVAAMILRSPDPTEE